MDVTEAMIEARKMWVLAAATLERDVLLHGMTAEEQDMMICAVLNAFDRARPTVGDEQLLREAREEIGNLKHDLERQMTIANTECNEAEKLREALENTRGALDTAAKTFRRYGELHRVKGTREGDLKASNNDDLAEFCESVLADYAALARRPLVEGK
jgi:hypothetical protein